MSALEREIIEKFHQLPSDGKARIRALIEQETEQANSEQFDYAAWLRDVEALRVQIGSEQGGMIPAGDVVEMLSDIRDGEDE